MRATVWSWIHDPAASTRCLLAETADGLVGLAHTRPFARPLSASVGEYLDDLFVLPSARGLGVASALIEEIDAAPPRTDAASCAGSPGTTTSSPGGSTTSSRSPRVGDLRPDAWRVPPG